VTDTAVAARARSARRLARRLDPLRAGPGAWAASSLGCAGVVWLCVAFIDRKVAVFFSHGLGPAELGPLLARLPALLPLVLAGLAVAIAWAVWRGPAMRRLAFRLGVMAGAYGLAMLAKTLGKWVCGRAWPQSWGVGNLSYLADGVYGFHPFQGGAAFGAFPSGHMCATMAMLVVAWAAWPGAARLWGAMAAAMAGLLIGFDFHFVADVVAGAWLGTLCGTVAVRLARRLRPAAI
jgi:membrane-associated phospholipid phosphatase